jgi:hypothetical protein
MASINLTAAGNAGTHSFRRVNVNTEEDYVYFKNADIPVQVNTGSTFIYDRSTGDIDGIDEGDLVLTQIDSLYVLRLKTLQGNLYDLTSVEPGVVTFNFPYIFDGKINAGSSTPTNQAVKYYTADDPITGLVSGQTYFLRNVPADFSGAQSLYQLTNDTHTFTTCGQTGRVGPNSTQILNSYSTSWHGTYLRRGQFDGYQDWTVPVSGIYEFTVRGASGFNGSGTGTVGRGAIIRGRVNLTKSEIITIVAGQVGGPPRNTGTIGGSGGGSFVVQKSSNAPIFVAGGGSSKTNLTGAFNIGKDGTTSTVGGLGGSSSSSGGSNGEGGPGTGGRSGGGGGFFTPGGNGSINTGFGSEIGGGSFASGLVHAERAAARNGGDGGFGGAGASDNNSSRQSGGSGGYSGGAGARVSDNDRSGGGGASYITPVASNIATSNGQYEFSSTFNGEAITNLNQFNTGEGSVTVELVEAFTSGNTVHPTAVDAANGTNAIAIAPAGNSYHAFIPINYDIQNNRIYSPTPHGLGNGQAIAFSFAIPTPDITNDEVYYVNLIDAYTYSIIFSTAVNFTIPPGKSASDTVRRIVVNLQLDTFTIPSHGFAVDQPLQYDSGGGQPIETAIGFLQNGSTYYVSEIVDQNNFKIKLSLESESSLDLVAVGTGTQHSFIFLTVNLDEDQLYIPSHGLTSGQAVTYATNGGIAVGGLVDGQQYFVFRIDSSTIRLASDQALQNTVDLTSTGTGTHALFIQSINFTTNIINLPQHGFLQGELVVYDSKGQTVINGLEQSQTYYVIFVNGDNIQLASSPDNARDFIAIDLVASPAAVGVHSLTSLTQTPDGIYEIKSVPTPDTFIVTARGNVPVINKTFNPRSAANIDINAFYVPDHGFLTGTRVIYKSGPEGVPVDGIVDNEGAGQEYFVSTINQDYFRLGSTKENADSGITLAINDFGDGTAHSFESRQLNGLVVGSGDVSVLAGSVLVNGSGTSFSKILKVGDNFTLYPAPISTKTTFGASNVNVSANRIDIAHSFVTGDFVRFDVGGGVAPTPLINGYYYYIERVDGNSFRLYTTLAGAQSGEGFISFSNQGSGTNFSVTKEIPKTPIVRKITAVGSDTQVTVDRPYSDAYTAVAYAYPTFIYARPSGYSLHRPFDGGVEMSTGAGTWFGQIIRQTRKYFRYQSGKGIQTSFAINFKPSIDLESMTRFSSNQIICTTRRPHNLINDLVVQVAQAENSTGQPSTIYNGSFAVTVIDDLTFRINAGQTVPTGVESRAYGFPQFHVTSWRRGAVRSGMFDFQNGMFFEFDGQNLYCVRRSSTQQIAGTVSVLKGSELVFGENTSFTAQLDEGDFIVLRGQTYKVIEIKNDTELSVRPEYKGSPGVEIIFNPQTQINTETNTFSIVRHGLIQKLPLIYNSIDGQAVGGLVNGRTYYADIVDANQIKLLASPDSTTPIEISSLGTTTVHSFVPAKSGIIVTKTVDTKVPQSEWSIDKCDGTGPSGYNLDLSRIQMCYMDFSWYGAGKIRYGFKTGDGLVRYVHEFKHNNILFESYFRSGNLPARYEVNTLANPTYIPSLFHWGTSVIMDGTFDDDRGYLFTAGSQTLSIDGTTTKSFAGTGIDLQTDLVTSLTHGFRTGNIVQFQSIASDGLPGLNTQNPATQIVGSNTFAFLQNTGKYGILVNSPDRIHLTPANATFVTGGTVARSGSTVTVVTSSPHNLTTGMYVGIYGIVNANLANANGAFTVTRVDDTTFTYTSSGTAQTVVTESGLSVAEVINFTTRGNIQFTYFLHPDGSLNNTTGPNYQPLISLRLSPSADSGLTGKLGDRDIINRMQVRMQEIGVSTNDLVEVKLILNGRLNNLGFVPVAPPSLVELVEHTPQDTISGGIQIYNFQAEANSTTNLDLDALFELSNSILGGDNIFPDGPDILTVAVSRLTGNNTRSSAKLSWSEAQA